MNYKIGDVFVYIDPTGFVQTNCFKKIVGGTKGNWTIEYYNMNKKLTATNYRMGLWCFDGCKKIGSFNLLTIKDKLEQLEHL